MTADAGSTAPRPAVLRGATHRFETPFGPAFVIVNETAPGVPVEVLVSAGKAGSDLAGLAEAIGRLCSLSLRLPDGMDPLARLRAIVDQLDGIGGTGSVGPGQVCSLPAAIARALATHADASGTAGAGRTGG